MQCGEDAHLPQMLEFRMGYFPARRNFGLTTNMTLKMLGVLYVRMRDLPCGHWVLLRGKERSERDRCPMMSLKMGL